jgi:hypothetical protein
LGPVEPNAPGSPVEANPSPTRRARIGLVVIVAVLTEVVLVAAGANQWVADRIVRSGGKGLGARLVESSWLTYSWRLTPHKHQTAHWGSQLLLLLTLFVVTGALVAVLLRGPVAWTRAFFGTWLAVVFATILGAIVRGLLDPVGESGLPGANRLTRAFFGSSGPTGVAVTGALALGLVVALVTSVVAVSTRRADESGTPAPPTFPEYAPPAPSAPPTPPPWQDRPDQPTTRLAPPPEAPRAAPPAEPPRPAPTPNQPTTRFPRPPDDEDLGHLEH